MSIPLIGGPLDGEQCDLFSTDHIVVELPADHGVPKKFGLYVVSADRRKYDYVRTLNASELKKKYPELYWQ